MQSREQFQGNEVWGLLFNKAMKYMVWLVDCLILLVQISVVFNWMLPAHELQKFPWDFPSYITSPVVSVFRPNFGDVRIWFASTGTMVGVDVSPWVASVALYSTREILTIRPVLQLTKCFFCWLAVMQVVIINPPFTTLAWSDGIFYPAVQEATSWLAHVINTCIEFSYTSAGLAAGLKAVMLELVFRQSSLRSMFSGFIRGDNTVGFIMLSNVLLKLSCLRLIFGALYHRMNDVAWGLLGVIMYNGIDKTGGIPVVLTSTGGNGWPTVKIKSGALGESSLFQLISFDVMCRPCINLVNHLASLSPTSMLFYAGLALCIGISSSSNQRKRYLYIVAFVGMLGLLCTMLIQRGLITPDIMGTPVAKASTSSSWGDWPASLWPFKTAEHGEL